LISTEAGNNGNGGNMNINAKFIVAVPKEDSDIVANAERGRGGNINITTQGIYGLQYRPQRTPLSDITASSQFGVNGTVQINTPGIDPSRGLANLPENLVDTSALIANSCIARSSQQDSSFTIILAPCVLYPAVALRVILLVTQLRSITRCTYSRFLNPI
jgi:large exoprotein involved in heme utilization and adhesion